MNNNTSIKLYGSSTSPYVRRIRLFLLENQLDYEWHPVDIYNPQEHQQILKISPTLRLPVAEINNEVIWDSFLIQQRLLSKPLNFAQQKQLFLVNEANDAAVYLFQSEKFNVDPTYQGKPAQQCLVRLSALLEHVEKHFELSWDIIGIAVFCLLDWGILRGVIDLSKFPKLTQFTLEQAHQDSVKLTDPRQ